MFTLSATCTLGSAAVNQVYPDIYDLASWLVFDRAGSLSPLVETPSANMGWLFDQTGTLKARPHNLIRSSSMQGAVVGTPGTAPVRWSIGTNGNGWAWAISGVGVEDGWPFIDVTFSGTATSLSEAFINPEPTAAVAASAGQTFTGSFYVRRVGGSNTGIGGANTITRVVDASANGLQSVSGANVLSVLGTGTLADRRTSSQITSSNASTAGVQTYFRLFPTSVGSAVNITLRIGGPQLNQGELQPYNPTTGTAYYGPRVSYDPADLSVGKFLLAEEARTNSIRNNTMRGAVAGTPGTLPTNWSLVAGSTGITSQVVGTGTEQGVPYIDIRYSGTATASASFSQRVEVSNSIVASNAQRWSMSSWVKLVAGSQNGIISIGHQYVENNSAGSFITSFGVAFSIGTSWSRYVTSRTLVGTGTAFLSGGLYLTVINEQPINITLRIGLPQLELGATASSPILTYGTPVTRAADNLQVTNLAATGFNASEGTIYVDAVAGKTTSAEALSLTDGTSGNRIDVFRYSSSGNPSALVIVNNGNQAIFTSSSFDPKKFAVAYKADDFAASAGGGAVVKDTSGIVPIVTTLHIGCRNGANDHWLGRIYQAAIIPKRLPDSGLQRLTR